MTAGPGAGGAADALGLGLPYSSPAAPALVDSESCEVPCARRAMNFSACESTLGATRAAFIDSGAGGDSSVGGHPSMMEELR